MSLFSEDQNNDFPVGAGLGFVAGSALLVYVRADLGWSLPFNKIIQFFVFGGVGAFVGLIIQDSLESVFSEKADGKGSAKQSSRRVAETSGKIEGRLRNSKNLENGEDPGEPSVPLKVSVPIMLILGVLLVVVLIVSRSGIN